MGGLSQPSGYHSLIIADPAIFLEMDFFQPHVAQIKPMAFILIRFFIDIGEPGDYYRLKECWSKEGGIDMD